jgi:hypothetical protein
MLFMNSSGGERLQLIVVLLGARKWLVLPCLLLVVLVLVAELLLTLLLVLLLLLLVLVLVLRLMLVPIVRYVRLAIQLLCFFIFMIFNKVGSPVSLICVSVFIKCDSPSPQITSGSAILEVMASLHWLL